MSEPEARGRMPTTRMDQTDHRKAKDSHGQGALELADLARFRQVAYRLFSTMLLYPDEERLKTVSAVAGELGDQGDFLVTFPFFIQWSKLLDTLQRLTDMKPARVQEEYVDVFLFNPDYSPNLPYESAYLGSGAAATGWTAVGLEREYAAAGLSISPALKEPPDHAAVELEFMAFLCDQEACAWQGRRLVDGIKSLKHQAAFLERHLSRWFPTFARGVAGRESSQVYAVVTGTAQSFIIHDRDLLEALLKRFGSGADPQPADSVSKTPTQGRGRCHRTEKTPPQKRA
ncbi:MAG: molecular chaperone [Candidatus Methylomirabilales bacterium]